ncbi:MAG: hypothetical protein PHH00_01795 [Candidatus Nanoarchaeia archaeon]|nr:hypothetical protein [Candidatus Nanoarchaeia archaeon]
MIDYEFVIAKGRGIRDARETTFLLLRRTPDGRVEWITSSSTPSDLAGKYVAYASKHPEYLPKRGVKLLSANGVDPEKFPEKVSVEEMTEFAAETSRLIHTIEEPATA